MYSTEVDACMYVRVYVCVYVCVSVCVHSSTVALRAKEEQIYIVR